MKKILSIAIAAIMVFCLAVSVCADYEPAATLGLQVGNVDNGGWDYTDVVEVTAPGTYTLTYEGEARAIDWLVIKSTDDNRDGTVVVNTSIPAGTIIRITALEIDGTAYAFDSGDTYDSKAEFGGTVEIQPYNVFTGNDHITNRPAEASKVVITFVVDPDNAPAEPEAPAAEENEPATQPDAVPVEDVEPETTPAAEPAPAAPATGVALAVVPAIIAMAAAAVSKKR